jgi:hypothetical protein
MLGDVLASAVLWALMPLLATPLRPLRSPGLVRLMLLSLSVGMGYEIAARALPLERRAAEWMRLAPVPPGSWAVARLLSVGSLALAVVAIAAAGLGIAARSSPGDWLNAATTVLPALALSVALGLWTGATFGNRDWTSPRGVLTLGGRLVAAALVIVQVAGWLGFSAIEEAVSKPPFLPWLPEVLACGLAALATVALARRIGRPGCNH